MSDCLSHLVTANAFWLVNRLQNARAQQDAAAGITLDVFEAAFKAMDLDSSGSLDEEEIMGMMRLLYRGKLSTQEIEEKAAQFLAIFDEDGDGEVDWDEFQHHIALMKEGSDNGASSGFSLLQLSERVRVEVTLPMAVSPEAVAAAGSFLT